MSELAIINQPEQQFPVNMPARFEHCVKVWDAMNKSAGRRADQKVYYTGFLTVLVKGLGLSNPEYTHITRALKDMQCISQIKRGGGATPTIWQLLRRPTEELWLKQNPIIPRTASTDHRVAELKAQLDIMEETFQDHQDRMQRIFIQQGDKIARLEAQMKTLVPSPEREIAMDL